jgi:hypothetical protein
MAQAPLRGDTEKLPSDTKKLPGDTKKLQIDTMKYKDVLESGTEQLFDGDHSNKDFVYEILNQILGSGCTVRVPSSG